jgi:3-hydroxyacyl-CoA dehydrogenase
VDEVSTSGVAVVVGAGTMGSGIAADLANAGWEVRLLDVTAEAAAAGLERVRTAKPPLLFLPEYIGRIHPAGMTDAAAHLADADWVIEAVAERMDIKRDVLARIAAGVPTHAIVTSNTSGLGITAMSAHLPTDFRLRFFGTHFLNPPRYLKLLEVIPTTDSDPEVVTGFVRFAEQVLGHRVVLAKDTPGFISTRLWITHLLDTIHTAEEMGVDVETVDTLTGPLIGRPRSATFRMADLVGLDIIAAVAANQYDALPHDPLRERLRLPHVVRRLLDAGRTGEKAGAGFYRREGKNILALDLATLEYLPRRDEAIGSTEPLTRLPLGERLAELGVRNDTRPFQFLNAVLDRLTDYAAAVGPEIAGEVLTVDRAMQWGFGWEMGPFEIADHCASAEGRERNYDGTPPHRTYRAFAGGRHPWPEEPEYIVLAELKAAGWTVMDTPDASLVDLGDGVLCLEFHTKMNTFRPEICAFIRDALTRIEPGRNALVIGNQGPHFSAGYDLSRLVRFMEEGDLSSIDREMRACQDAFMAIKYAPVSVVAAPHGFTLGAGCECALHCSAIQAAPELQMGLPESLVGVLPCGGGIKETLLRALEQLRQDGDPLEAARAALRTLVQPRNSGNAYEAQWMGWLRPSDGISRNADRRLYEAKRRALDLVERGYVPSAPRPIPVAGAAGLARLHEDIAELRGRGELTEHDARIADRIAWVLCGGDTDAGTVTEQTMLDLERAAFVELCREPASLARMKYLLETGKHLRN